MQDRMVGRIGFRAATLLLLLAWLAFGCSESVDVLELPKPDLPEPGREGDSADDSTPPGSSISTGAPSRVDAATGDAPDLPDPPSSSNPCGGCPPLQLCTPQGCIDSAGPTLLESGRRHSCLVADGRLYCWGAGGGGQLGVGDQEGRDELSRVGPGNDWFAVSGGESHTCGLRAPGRLYCWGDNTKGQLGLGDTNRRLVPERVGPGEDWEGVACGGDNCCALRDGGELHCWGDNREGKPGQDDGYTEPDVLEPRPVATEQRFAEVALGQGHVNAITLEGSLFGWGRTPMGETGTASAEQHLRAPQPLPVEAGYGFRSVTAAQHHSCAVRDDGTLWCWGSSPFGELGTRPVDVPGVDGDPNAMVAVKPVQVGGAVTWEAVGTGWFHTCATKQDGGLYCWGRAIEGQLGQGGGAAVGEPFAVGLERSWQRPVLGGFHTCALTQDDELFCWGENNAGQLGMAGERRHEPAQVELP